MAEKAADGLPYGQFGLATYDADGSAWHFGRAIDDGVTLLPLGEAETLVETSGDLVASTFPKDGKAGPTRRREKQAKALVQRHPELQPASYLLPDLARVSEAVEEAAQRYDPSRGPLIASGKIYDEISRASVPVLAFPCGRNGSDFRIVEMVKQRRGWDDAQGTSIEVVVPGEHGTTWEGPGVSISSIVFARPIEKGEWYLAVRLQIETLIFRPVNRKIDHRSGIGMELDLLATMSIEKTGGFPHADIIFNPWFTGQFATIDQGGSWSVWEFASRRSANAKLTLSGSLKDDDEEESAHLTDDGWGRVLWVQDATTLCICTRQELCFVSIDGERPRMILDIEAKLRGGVGWILDVACVQPFPSFLFVLTSSHVLIYLLDKSMEDELEWSVAATVRHHRSPDDLSLCMHLCAIDERIITVLRSALNDTITQTWVDTCDPDSIKIQLPNELHRSAVRGSEIGHQDVLDTHLQVVPHSAPKRSDSPESVQPPVNFCSVLFLSQGFAVHRGLYHEEAAHQLRARIDPPTKITEVSRRNKKKKHRVVEEDFIVEDEDDGAQHIEPPVSAHVLWRRKQAASRNELNWTVDHRLAVRQLNDVHATDVVDVEEIIEEASQLLRMSTKPSVPMRTLRELGTGVLNVDDVQGATARLASLGDIKPEQGRVKNEDEDENVDDDHDATFTAVSSLGAASLDLLGLHGTGNLSDCVEQVRSLWLPSGESQIPDETHAMRDQHATRMATEVTLATQLLRIGTHDDDEDPESQRQTQAWDLPIRSPPGALSSQLISSQPSTRANTPALPTPSASGANSTITASSRALNASSHISRLSAYTTFATPPAQTSLLRSLNRVLSHWTPGADPAEYDWLSATHQLSQRDDTAEGDEEMTEKERLRLQKRAERYVRRQRKEAEESRRMQLLSSQVPEVVSASQPAQPRGAAQVDSQGAAGGSQSQSFGGSFGPSQSFGAASQVVPGRHGGRPPARKKRKSGF